MTLTSAFSCVTSNYAIKKIGHQVRLDARSHGQTWNSVPVSIDADENAMKILSLCNLKRNHLDYHIIISFQNLWINEAKSP